MNGSQHAFERELIGLARFAESITLRVTGKGFTARITFPEGTNPLGSSLTMYSPIASHAIKIWGEILTNFQRGLEGSLEKPDTNGSSNGITKLSSARKKTRKKSPPTIDPNTAA